MGVKNNSHLSLQQPLYTQKNTTRYLSSVLSFLNICIHRILNSFSLTGDVRAEHNVPNQVWKKNHEKNLVPWEKFKKHKKLLHDFHG